MKKYERIYEGPTLFGYYVIDFAITSGKKNRFLRLFIMDTEAQMNKTDKFYKDYSMK